MTDLGRQILTNTLEASFEAWLDRAQRVVRPMLVPDTHFSAVLAEVRDCFIYGQFTAAITTAQSVAEGLAKYVAECHKAPVRFHMDEQQACDEDGQRVRRAGAAERINWLEAEADIDPVCIAAFRRIHDAHRNDFHHMNRTAPTDDLEQLEEMAEQCVRDLQAMEGWFFAFTFPEPGALAPVRRRYWPQGSSPDTFEMRIASNYPPPDEAEPEAGLE